MFDLAAGAEDLAEQVGQAGAAIRVRSERNRARERRRDRRRRSGNGRVPADLMAEIFRQSEGV